ncbi:hypothetical protein DRQ17_01555 [bacterium]|nr:MAG: hypothetical protein DRQ17_01555 [bacterium]
MRRFFILLLVILVFVGCEKRWEEVDVMVHSPNWGSDGKVLFVREERVWENVKGWFYERSDIKSEVSELCEVNADGSGYRVIGEIFDDALQGIDCISSAGEWVVIGDANYKEIWVMRRDGSGLEKVGYGLHPDFSPDASRIVYEKPDSGIWVMNRDGSNNHCIVPDADAKYPAWSPDDSLIAYGEWWTHIVNLDGDSIKVYQKAKKPDWGPAGSNKIITFSYFFDPMEINIETDEIDTISYFKSGDGIKWSPDGLWFIAYDGDWFVIRSNGTNKWYLKDLIK